MFGSTSLAHPRKLDPSAHAPDVASKNPGGRFAVGDRKVCRGDVTNNDPYPGIYVGMAWPNVEEENCENTSHTASKIRVKNGLAPRKRGNVLLGVLRHFAEKNSVLFVVAYNIDGWD